MKRLALLLVLLAGCSGTKYLGQVGGTKFYSVSDSKIDGPNFNALVTEKNKDVKIEQVFTGPGIGPSVVPTLIQTGGTIGGDAINKGILIRP